LISAAPVWQRRVQVHIDPYEAGRSYGYLAEELPITTSLPA